MLDARRTLWGVTDADSTTGVTRRRREEGGDGEGLGRFGGLLRRGEMNGVEEDDAQIV